MLVANHGTNAEFHHDPEQMSGDIGTAREVANALSKLFFAAVGADDARLDRYLRNRILLTSLSGTGRSDARLRQ